jgi:uncharacterized membrane protein
MLPALLMGIVTTLVQNNLPRVAQAVTEKGLDYVQDKLGVELKPEMTAEEIKAVAEAADKHEEFRITQANANTANARAMQVAALQQSDTFSKRFVMFLATGWSVFAMAYIIAITFATIPESNLRFADLVLGFLLGTIVATIINFFFGTSASSSNKSGAITDLAQSVKDALKR